MFKLIVLAVTLNIVVAYPGVHELVQNSYSEPNYEFAYSVEDKHTGDIKSQQEVRKGDQVEGLYTLVEENGVQRIVKYQADKLNGFNANYRRDHTNHWSQDHKGNVEVTGQSSAYVDSIHQNQQIAYSH